MILRLARRAFRSRADRRLDRYRQVAGQIVALAAEHHALPEVDLRNRMQELRRRAKSDDCNSLIVPTFALVREAARRTLKQEHVPAQLIGGLAMQDSCIAEMKTGEGKTLAATLVCTLEALAGCGVHIATPNDYLAGRDMHWMRPIYEMLGISVGLITQDMDDEARRQSYACDVTYGVASEFAFDFLRDNMKFTADETVQRGHSFALIDEADATLIDEASMPLALFGPLGDRSPFYRAIDSVVRLLQSDDFSVDERRRVTLTERGYTAVEQKLKHAELLKRAHALHDMSSIALLHHVTQSLRAHVLLQRDRDYIVQRDELVIVDKLTGRSMPGRRYDEGLHQALEAKENLQIGEETQTLSSITFQTFFGQYGKIAGMTGTASTDSDEYRQIYDLDVVSIPTHRPVIRADRLVMHSTQADKTRAIIANVEAASARGQPVLIGAQSIERSESLAALLEAYGWTRSNTRAHRTFAVLNAKYHAEEARIIAQAGMPGAVTIATAMAGRGTDIRLGGSNSNEQQRQRVMAAGGLLVIGAEHHDQRRFDDQFRGRSGRQGDPGETIFHASLEDDLLQQGPSLTKLNKSPIADPAVAQRLVRRAQKQNESRNFDERITLLRFEATIQRQRQTIYEQRRSIRDDADPLQIVDRLRHETIDDLMAHFAPSSMPWDIEGLDQAIRTILTLAIPIEADRSAQENGAAALRDRIVAVADQWMSGKIAVYGQRQIGDIMRRIMMALIDQVWTEQLDRLEHLKRIIRDRRLPPYKVAAEFEIEAFALFEVAMRDFRHNVTSHAMRLGFEKS